MNPVKTRGGAERRGGGAAAACVFPLLALCYLVTPVWAVPSPPLYQWLAFNLLLVFCFLTARAYAAFGDSAAAGLPGAGPALAVPFVVAGLSAAFFWGLPVPVGTDEQSHIGPAAVLLDKTLPLPWTRLPLLLAAAFLFFSLRRRAAALPAWAAAALLNAYCLAFIFGGLLEPLGKWETLLRYPPAPKFLYLAAYMAGGISEYWPRIIQFLFVCGAALSLTWTAGLFSPRLGAAAAFAAALLFPPFFNLALWAELEGGTVFFFALSSFFFARSLKRGERGDMTLCSLVLLAGIMYRQLVLGHILAMLAALAALWLAEKERRAFYLACGLRLLPSLAAGLPMLVAASAYDIRTSGLVWSNFLSLEKMTLNLRILPLTLGWPVLALTLAAAAWAAVKYRGREMFALLWLSAAYYFMISGTSAVGYVRHLQPAFLFPVLALVLAFGEFSAAPRLRPYGRLAALLPAALLWYSAVLSPVAFHRKTLPGMHDSVYPYPELAAWLAEERRNLSVYAPMEVEPANFYLARNGLSRRIRWHRAMPDPFSPAELEKNFRAGGFDLLVLPGTNFEGIPADFESAGRDLLASGRFCEARSFGYADKKLSVLKPCAE